MCKGYIKISRLLDINAVYICIQDINVLVQLVSGVIIKKPHSLWMGRSHTTSSNHGKGEGAS